MITSKQDLRMYMRMDMNFYYKQSTWERFVYWLTADASYCIAKYIRHLRKEEYYLNVGTGKIGRLLYMYHLRKKNVLGNKLGFRIPSNCFGAGLTIFHHGEVIVNEAARIGVNARLHGGNCIGNNGINEDTPKIGDNLDLGIGAKIIGDVKLGNRIRVGANAVVTKSYMEDDITLVGVPTRKL